MKRRAVMIGAGGFAGVWARTFLPAFRDRLEIVGLADINPAALARSADTLGLPAGARFATYAEMLSSVDADVCFLVIPPAARTGAVRLAAERGLAVLCEKPVAASWEQTREIAAIVESSGIRFAVMQNYRLSNRMVALKRVLARPELGAVNLLACRFAVDFTLATAGGAFRHQIPDALIFEGAEHHLDQFRNLLDADGTWVMGTQWNRPWSTFPANCCVSLLASMTNGTICQYEMNHIARGHQNGWGKEYYRLECEGGSVTLDADDVIRMVLRAGGEESFEAVAIDGAPGDGHLAAIAQFLDWLDGGPPPVTVMADNIRTMALTFAAVEATHTGTRVGVPTGISQPITPAPVPEE